MITFTSQRLQDITCMIVSDVEQKLLNVFDSPHY